MTHCPECTRLRAESAAASAEYTEIHWAPACAEPATRNVLHNSAVILPMNNREREIINTVRTVERSSKTTRSKQG